ncbi:uncharacterized protein YjiS (DUF1127 family) [Bradyrhizobium huanghuaihaiense]|uniref:Uncharacterized protein DUF1127 n=1 Tax=Bradyrhizobium huanghuaihaiense TaxID=990078 RepID=A0A562R2P5_9BRAD|nr:DUF1127 domain-containing protein [Bradyrhizobium huanghuaihaiense]TWI63345.1 uncharacterized protein DUF1127 [Bradyrhizobium huanghuaihaiense]
MKTHSRSVVRSVRPDDAEPGGQGRVAWSDGRGMARLGPDRTTRLGHAETRSPPTLQAAAPGSQVSLFRSVAFAFMEGFALYGAALHPSASMPVHAILAARREWEPYPEADEPAKPVPDGDGRGPCSSGNVVKFDRVLPPDVQPERRWSWLRSAGETLTVLLAHLRREREIRRAVAALTELDDRTLRDLGIRGRSDVERMVRYCRDC